MTPPTLNGLRAISVRLCFTWVGVWLAEVILDLDDVALAPSSGPALLSVGGAVLRGTVDPGGSGVFLNRATVRVLGGAGGWAHAVPAQHFTTPTGTLLSTVVYTATATLVGEVVLDPLPAVFNTDFVRSAGAASRVFEDRDWHVDPVSGVTTVSAWPPLPLDPDATIADFEIVELRATVLSETLIQPGTLLADERFGATTYIVRDVEQTFDASGSHASCLCSANAASRLQSAFTDAVRESVGLAFLKMYRYRFAVGVGGKLALQAVTAGAPDLRPIDQWVGAPGMSNTLAPGAEIVVGFVSPREGVVLSYLPGVPLTTSLAAATSLTLTAPAIALVGAVTASSVAAPSIVAAGGTRPLAAKAPIDSAMTALAAAMTALGSAVPAAAGPCGAAATACSAESSAPPAAVLG